MRTTLALALALAGCDRVIDLAPDARGPTVTAIWDPRACAIDPRARVQVRLEDRAGTILLGDAPCVTCTLTLEVPHVGWYWASALASDHVGNGRALATAVIAVDQPSTRWLVPWPP